jgi:two-component system, NtrC family, nitrogen regulation sensor histidine kinase NtrY
MSAVPFETPEISKPASAGSAEPSVWRGRGAVVFAAVFSLCVVVTAVAVFLTTATPGDRAGAAASSRVVLTILGLDLLVVLGLAGVIGWRVHALFGRRAPDAGVRLHQRFVSLFALAAVAPAIIVAVFFGLLVTRGMDNWFSSRVQSAVEGGALFGNAIVHEQTSVISGQVGMLAASLNRPVMTDLLLRNPVTYSIFLDQALERGFAAVYVVDGSGRILARAEGAAAPAYLIPPVATFQAAEKSGEVRARFDDDDVMRAVYRLGGAPNTFLYVARPLEPGLSAQLRSSQQSVREYKESLNSRYTIQAIFLLSYANTALLVLVGAVWVGMGVATQIAAPVARLVVAADRVAMGDLGARVELDNDLEEIAVLSNAFNRMTSDLEGKQAALQAASHEAQERRQFIETVLGGVSAGVLGIDSTGCVSAANFRAMVLLGVEERPPAELHAVPLSEVAPEMMATAVRALASASDMEEEVDITRGNDTRRLRVRASVGLEAGLVLTFDDITRLVSAQRNAAWKDVARRIAHEIKNPLTPIQLSAERIRRKYRKDITSDLETFDRCTDTIIRQVGDIGRMVDEFSAFARMPTPKFAIEDARELLRQAVFAQRVAHPDVTYELDEPAAPLPLTCDARMVGQALTNILKNAAESVEARVLAEADPLGVVRSRLVVTATEIVFEIQDNGIGLPDRDRSRLTEPYVTTREKGTGLGLAIVKRILEEHGGELVLTDADPRPGARIRLHFPSGNRVEQPASELATSLQDGQSHGG